MKILTHDSLKAAGGIKILAKKLKLDFGSIDVIESLGVDYVIDVNKTPWEREFPNLFLEVIRKSLRGHDQ